MVNKVMDFVNGIFKAKEQKSSKDESAWRKLLRDIATGKAKNPEETLSELERIGKTPEELRAALVRFDERSRYAERYKTLPDIEANIQKSEAELLEMEAAVHAVHAKYDLLIESAVLTIQALHQQRSQAEEARRSLLFSGNDPVIDGRIERLDQHLQQLESALAEKKATSRTIGINGGKLQDAEERVQRASDMTERLAAQADVTELRARLAEYSADIAGMETEKKSLLKQIELERETYLDPACFG